MFELYVKELLTMTTMTDHSVQTERTKDIEHGFDLVEPRIQFTEFIAPN